MVQYSIPEQHGSSQHNTGRAQLICMGTKVFLDSNVDVSFFLHTKYFLKKQKNKKNYLKQKSGDVIFPSQNGCRPRKIIDNWLIFLFFSFSFCVSSAGCCCSLTNSCFEKYGTFLLLIVVSVNTTTPTLHTAHWGRGTTQQDLFISRSSWSRILQR